MKAISVKYPWCALIASGEKTIEVRSWATAHRGPLLIVSTVAPPWEYAGHSICIVDLVDVRPLTADDLDAACADDGYIGDFAWVLANPRIIDPPFRVRGMPGIYEVSMD